MTSNGSEPDRVEMATLDHLETVVEVLTDAFVDDPIMAWAFERSVRPRRLAALWTFMAGEGYLPRGRSALAGSAGAALWLGPGEELGDAFWEARGADFATAVEGDVERLGALGQEMGARHPSVEHWYLLAIGCRSAAQGRGVGSALLEHTLALVDESGHSAYLEATTPRSRALYERFGFVVTAEFSAADSPPLWGMWREPRSVR